jgi:hypothetical protein
MIQSKRLEKQIYKAGFKFYEITIYDYAKKDMIFYVKAICSDKKIEKISGLLYKTFNIKTQKISIQEIINASSYDFDDFVFIGNENCINKHNMNKKGQIR